MRKLTALSVAFSLSVAGQAFAGAHHAPAEHPAAHVPAAPAAHTSVGQPDHGKKLEAVGREIFEKSTPEQQMEIQIKAQQIEQKAQQDKAQAPADGGIIPAVAQNYYRGLPVLEAIAVDAKKIEENPGAIKAKVDDAAKTADDKKTDELKANAAAEKEAAGEKVTQKVTSEVNNYAQGAANAPDGINLLNAADGSLVSMTINLQRAADLAKAAKQD